MVVWALAILSMLSLWLVVFAVALSPLQEARTQSVLYSQLREQLALQVAPLGGVIAPGAPVALISAPSLGINDLVVVEGTASGDLLAGPGHRRDTVLPGQAGVAVVYGRSRLAGAPFGAIGNAQAGTQITVTTGQGVFVFTVITVRREGEPLPPLLASGAGRLTLVSSDSQWGGLVPAGAVFVDADLSGDGQPSPGVAIARVPRAETAMQTDPSALFSVALTAPLVLGALIFMVWSWSRWGRWQTWLVGVPLLLATLWAMSGPVMQMLPNLS